MTRTVSTDWFADHLQNELTPGTVAFEVAAVMDAAHLR